MHLLLLHKLPLRPLCLVILLILVLNFSLAFSIRPLQKAQSFKTPAKTATATTVAPTTTPVNLNGIVKKRAVQLTEQRPTMLVKKLLTCFGLFSGNNARSSNTLAATTSTTPFTNIPTKPAEALSPTQATTSNQQRMAYLIFNPSAGADTDSEEILRQIYSILEPEMPVSVIYTDPDKDPYEQSKEIVDTIQARPADSPIQPVIVASGGDGTVSAVANAVMNTDVPFGIIPRGTANAFAKALDIPTAYNDIEAACQVILDGHERYVDAAKTDEACGGTMILLAGIGFEANMVETANTGNRKQIMGPLAYVAGGIKEVVYPEVFECEIVADTLSEPLKVKAHAITVAAVAPMASVTAQGTGNVIIDDGLLDITIQTSETMLESLDSMMHLFGAALVEQPAEAENIFSFRARSISITSCEPKQQIVVDGELYAGQESFHFSVMPKALRVLVPPPLEQAPKEEMMEQEL